MAIILAVGAALLQNIVTPPAATAAGATCGTQNNYFDGADSAYTTANYGVRASIEWRDPALCNSGSSTSASSAWAMLIPRTPSNQYAQAGYYKQGTNVSGAQTPNGIHMFAQATRACYPNCTGYNTISGWTTGGPPSGSTMYSVYLRASDGLIHMYEGSTNLLTMNRSVSGEWSTDWGGSFSGETWHTSSDMPGTSSNTAIFNYIQYYNSSGQINFISSLGTPYSDSSRYHNSVTAASVGGRRLDIWTE